jgi:maltose alpha-D-glucosyltransferase/alpha-amylase
MTTAELTRTALSASAAAQSRDTAHWFKDAIIYQLHVRAFRDANNDGIGDFRGLTERLDYIQDLGVTAVWLQPFFPSPLKDDGYDIADYTNVNPQYGTLEDFQVFLEEAHRHDLHVISELVMNHTSDQHDWFQRSRRAAPETPWRDWYVWSDTPDRYREARIIFQDFETSNWSWDPIAGAYFWHRFYSHQPDLNFDNPEVRQAMIEILDFWLGMGVDGLRLDAVPYLFEREDTNCENLPETHAFLRELRVHIDERFEDKMLLAEANQWPEDAAAYFGDGDECHMNFHFPLMPRLFMAVEREDRSPIVDILEQTPLLPPSCQWAIFLRNHDELTLEMVTDEERDYMYRAYTLDAKARINLGIRRRLAPLMGNNRRKIELMNSLLLSLPGTPIMYYGDEIGMGDNYHLGDRNGVRTPMQWNADRNAGFSRANPQSLYLPVIIDPEYHYELRNVEVDHANPHSLLWWVRRILDLRKQYMAFGHGSFESLSSSNPKVFAYVREAEEETLMMVANLSRHSQFVELDLTRYRGLTPTELFGHTPFPIIEDAPYRLSLGPYGFFWFSIGSRPDEADVAGHQLPTLHIRHDISDLFAARSQKQFGKVLATYLQRQRWFSGKARMLQFIELADAILVNDGGNGPPFYVLLLDAIYSAGEPESYCVPVVAVDEQHVDEASLDGSRGGIVRIERANGEAPLVLCDATSQADAWVGLHDMIVSAKRVYGRHGEIAGTRTNAYDRIAASQDELPEPRLHGGEQSNTSAAFGKCFILKLFRRLSPGVNPDLEIGRQLTEHHDLKFVPQVAGALEYRSEANKQWSLGVLHEFVPNVGDSWTYALDELNRYLERVQAVDDPHVDSDARQPNELTTQVAAALRWSILKLTFTEPPQLVQDLVGGILSWAELLGRRTGELHIALASTDGGPAFSPEAFTRLYQRGLYQSMRSQARATIELLRAQKHRLDEDAQRQADRTLECERSLYARFSELTHELIHGQRIRCHGDLHLGQVLYTGKDFVIIDFEGEPERPVSERRIKASPLRDIAGMLRSFHYAAHAAICAQAPTRFMQHAAVPIHDWANFWAAWVSAAFLRSYLAESAAGKFLPQRRSHLQSLLRAYLLEKALYELRYELNNRPDWVNIPLEGISQYCRDSAEDADAGKA